jgi:hypothetical protein
MWLSSIRNWYFAVSKEKKSIIEIILWWEFRRIPYNIIVGIAGIISLVAFYFFIGRSGILEPWEDAVEPLTLFVAPFIFNFCYTAGWVCEVTFKIIRGNKFERISQLLMKLGVEFSLFIVMLPAILWGEHYLLKILRII